MDVVPEFVGSILGGLFFGYALFSLISVFINIITKYKINIKKNLNISLLLSIIVVFIWGMIWNMTIGEIFTLIPFVILIYLYDRRTRLKRSCPQCKESIRYDALKCKHCQSEMNVN